MIYLATNHASIPTWRIRGLPVGWLLSTAAGWRTPTVPFAIDNGMYHDPGAHPKGMKFLPPFYAMVRRAIRGGHSPMFIACPDVPYDMTKSRDFSRKHLRHLRAECDAPIAVVLQDGATDDDLDGYDWAFLGGSTDFKWGRLGYYADACAERGMPLHVGRVNSGDRILACHKCGAASADGTSWGRGDRRQFAGIVAALRIVSASLEGVSNPCGAQRWLFPGGAQVPTGTRAYLPGGVGG